MGNETRGKDELRLNPSNPRKITDEKLKQLSRSMDEYGDISGIVFNIRTGNLVGGNQRSRDLDETSKVVITERFKKPSKVGTVAVGYILHHGERFSYREVDWPEPKETAAMIAANKNAGTWDDQKLSEQLKHLASFDIDYPLDLTMFDEVDFASHGISFDDETTGTSEETDDEGSSRETSPSKLVHQCPRCGYEFR